MDDRQIGLADLEVTPDRAAELAREGAQLVDVRERYEWEAGRISDARHVELRRLAEKAHTIDASRPVIFVCRVGGRSAISAQSFRAAGYSAYSMAGGLEEWRSRGLPLEPDGAYVAPH